MSTSLAESYRYCEALTRREAKNFYPAFRILPREQRLAMCAIYAFMRIADDISDEPGAIAEKQVRLEHWRQGLHGALGGEFEHPIHEALNHTLTTFAVPTRYLEDVLDGVAMDLEPVSFATFEELRVYCYRVASAVGLACIHIWGFAGEEATLHAKEAGYAFQLTNILRDLKEDAERGRVYLPSEDLERFGYSKADLANGVRNESYRALMRFQVERARSYYESSRRLTPLLRPGGRAIFHVMSSTYRNLLETIERRDYDVFSSRTRVPAWRKLYFLMQAIPLRYGWT